MAGEKLLCCFGIFPNVHYKIMHFLIVYHTCSNIIPLAIVYAPT